MTHVRDEDHRNFDQGGYTNLELRLGSLEECCAPIGRRATPLEVLMPGKLGLPEILLILAVALLIFGPSKLASLGKGLGEGIKNFKSAVKEGEEGDEKKPQ